ncbi:MAG: hypothetical protein RJA70_2653, partial [Pseudomonadota bacterium]
MKITRLILLASLGALLSACGDDGGSNTTPEVDAGADDGGTNENNGNENGPDGGNVTDDGGGAGSGKDAGPNDKGDAGTKANRAPLVKDAKYTTEEDMPIVDDLVSVDPDGDDVTYAITVEPAHGTVAVVGTEVTYTPDLNYHGEDSFTYEASDGKASAEGVVTITVTPVNDPPSVEDLMFTITEGATLAPADSLVLAGTDVDGDVLSATVAPAAPPTGGSLTIGADGKFSYEHAGVVPSDNFVFELCDPDGLCVEGTVDITITLVNAPPVAADDDYQVAPSGTLNVGLPGLLNNDSDPDNDLLTVKTTPTVLPTKGNVVLNADGSFSYTNTGAGSSDTFSYEVCDPSDECDSAKVDIVIAAPGAAPVAVNDAYSVDEGGTLNGTSVLGNDTIPTTVTVSTMPVTAPAHGTLVLDADGTFVYTHDGSEQPGTDSFAYRICDPSQQCSTATVTLTINPVNEDPIAVADAYTLLEGATLT